MKQPQVCECVCVWGGGVKDVTCGVCPFGAPQHLVFCKSVCIHCALPPGVGVGVTEERPFTHEMF